MDQVIVDAFVAPAKLVWEHDLAKELLSRNDTKEEMASMPVAVTAIFNVSGELTGRVLYVLTKQTAMAVGGALSARWPEEIDERTIDAVSQISDSAADHARSLLDQVGYKCDVELLRVIDSGGKGIANPDKWAHATQLATAPDIENPANMDELGIWLDVKVAGGVEPKSAKAAEPEEPPGESPPGEAVEANGSEAGPTRFRELSANVFRVKRIEIPDPSGTARATVGTMPDGSPFVVLSGSEGRIRATLALSANGTPRLALADDIGKTVYEVPSPARMPPRAARRPVRRPARRPGRVVPRKIGRPRRARTAAGRAPVRQRPAR